MAPNGQEWQAWDARRWVRIRRHDLKRGRRDHIELTSSVESARVFLVRSANRLEALELALRTLEPSEQ